ncbi:hypothetical protein [[Phormidium] sp. ETS-05]|nr:hypothetical protein [[Phormidium] sp. ETS-05]
MRTAGPWRNSSAKTICMTAIDRVELTTTPLSPATTPQRRNLF